ncbi:cyanophycinase [Alishewanella agri BL06]|uniref:Cyanophycinase n=1 Tax=Alishewanella agri BL06 TaxID=1195246 RepID=I8U7H2_9ALTE|nr:cyanophycinase [Alishewanella agri]EIW87943.1 cyanophycinase [Alishewanella agri BL06]
MRLSCIKLLLVSSLVGLAVPGALAVEPQPEPAQTEQPLAAADEPTPAVEPEPSILDIASTPTQVLPQPEYDLMLMGGGLATCSSMSNRSCLEQTQFSALAKTGNLYWLQQSLLQNFATAEVFSAERKTLQQQLVQLFNRLAAEHTAPLTEQQLVELWRAAPATEQAPDGETLWQQLSDRELNVVFDYLEVPTLSSDGKYRLTEHVDLAQTSDQHSAELYREFVRLAATKASNKGRSAPKLLMVTASSRDPFAAVDFYLDAFRQAGAEVEWLPLTAALQAAMQAQNCQALPQFLADIHGSYRREQVYADLYALKLQACQAGSKALVAKIAAADGIFFNGGDQSLTYQALRFADGSASPELTAIFGAVANKQLLVGGTSAGTAVMSGNQWLAPQLAAVPMISNGDSYHALQYGAVAGPAPWPGCRKENRCPDNLSERQLTYTAAGGLGLFPLGVLDTHFAERGRQARLLVLQQATQTRLAFGVDEASAMLVDLGHYATGLVQMAARGAGEVYVSELQSESSKTQLLAHTYTLTAGDTLVWQAETLPQAETLTPAESSPQAENVPQQVTLTLVPAAAKTPLTEQAEPLHSKSPLFSRDHYRSLSRSLCRSNFHSATVSEPPYLIRLSKDGACSADAEGNLSYRQQLRIISPEE